MKKLSAIILGTLMLISTSSFADADVRIGQKTDCGENSTCGECVDQTGRGQENPDATDPRGPDQIPAVRDSKDV